MNLTTEDWPAYVQMLAKLTREDTLKWRSVALPTRSGASSSLSPWDTGSSSLSIESEPNLSQWSEAYETDFAERRIRLDQRREMARESPMGAVFRQQTGAQRELVNKVTLMLVDRNGAPLFVFPYVSDIQDLLAAVKAQIVDVRSFLTAVKLAAGSAA